MGSTAGGGGGVRVGEAMEQLDCSMAGAAGVVALPSAVGDRGEWGICAAEPPRPVDTCYCGATSGDWGDQSVSFG